MSTGTMNLTREMAEKVADTANVKEAYDVLEAYWPYTFMFKFKAYDWVAGEDAEVFCVKCAAKQLLQDTGRDEIPMGTFDCHVGEYLGCECGFIFDLEEDDEMFGEWIRGEWEGDIYDWQPYYQR